MKRATAVVAALLLGGAALLGLWRSTTPSAPLSLQARVEQVSAGLRCPTCAGESVAVSQAASARAARAEVQDQLEAGRSASQVRAWFAERYGVWVLLDPPARGAGLPLNVLPVVAVVGGGALLLAPRRHRSRAAVALCVAAAGVLGLASVATTSPADRTRAGAAVPVVAAAASASAPSSNAPGADAARTAVALEDAGRLTEAAQAYRSALEAAPGDPTLSVRLGFDLLRSGDADGAAAAVRPVLQRAPDLAQAVLVLGLAQRATGDPAATPTLQRFLALAPQDPAAATVQELLLR